MDSENNPLVQTNTAEPVEPVAPPAPAEPIASAPAEPIAPAPLEPAAPVMPETPATPAEQPASEIPAAPEIPIAPEPPLAPSPSPAKKKLSGGAIAGIIIGALAAIAAIILGILSALGIIDWSSLVGSIGIPGVSTGPSAALVKSTCERHNGTITAFDKEEVLSIMDSFTEGYYCEYNGSYSDDNAFEFAAYFINGSMIDYFRTTSGSLPPSSTILENSDDMIKFYYCSSSSNYCSYDVLYKNVVIELVSTNTATAEQALIELGLPNRSKAN
ncbi:hypothetical protein IJF85_00525 [Candidatus Saccharibacteria bacterium]|nr:hypothetical protein [Candidatus Saccharibacteria bacterium]MBQ3263570.1 hypothetical protein [Candidatus Saccharibacteria bacterium]